MTAITLLMLVAGIWRATSLYVDYLRASLGPSLVQRLEAATGRKITVGRLDYSVPGRVVLQDLKAYRSPEERSGTLVTAGKLVLTYDPSVLRWQNLLAIGLIKNTQARLIGQRLSLYDPEQPNAGIVLTTRHLDTSFDLGPALRGSKEYAALFSKVLLRGNHLRVARSASGEWSVGRFFRRKQPERPIKFRGEILAPDSLLELTDYRSGALPAPVRNAVHTDLSAQFAADPVVRFNARGKSRNSHTGFVRVSGNRNMKSGGWMVSVQADAKDVAYWYRYLAPASPTLKILNGQAYADLAAWGNTTTKETRYQLSMQVRDGAIRLANVPETIQRLQGRINVDPYLIHIEGQAAAAGAPIDATGDILLGPTGRTSLSVTSPQMTVSQVRRLLPALTVPEGVKLPGSGPIAVNAILDRGVWRYSGSASLPLGQYGETIARGLHMTFSGAVTGRKKDDAISGVVRARELQWRDTILPLARVDYRLRGQILQVESQAALWDGTVRGKGWVDLQEEKPSYYVSGTAKNVSLAQMPRPEPQPGKESLALTGTADAEFVMTGEGTQPVISAYVRSPEVTVGKERVGEVAGRIRYITGDGEDAGLNIAYATVRDPRWQLSLFGRVSPKGQLDVRASGSGLDLATVLEGRTEEAIRGKAAVSAHLTGTQEEPKLSARVQVYQPAVRDMAGDYAEAEVEADGWESVQLRSIKVIHAPELATSERLDLERRSVQTADGKAEERWFVKGDLRLEGFSLGRSLRLAGVDLEKLRDVPIVARLDPIKVSLEGEVTRPKVAFEATGSGAAVLGQDFGVVSAAGEYDMASGLVRISKASSEARTIAVTASGTVQVPQDGPVETRTARTVLNLEVQGTRAPLLSLVRRFSPQVLDYLNLTAAVERFDGVVVGTAGAPSGRFDVRWGAVSINDQAVAIEPTRLVWDPSGVLIRDLRARIGTGRIAADWIGVRLEKDEKLRLFDRLAGSLRAENVEIPFLREMVEDSPYFPTEDARPLREALTLWANGVEGTVDLALDLPDGGPSVPATPTEFVRRVAAFPDERRLTGKMKIPDLVSPPDELAPVWEVTADFDYGRSGFHLTEALVIGEEKERLRLTGDLWRRPNGENALDLTATAEALSLESLSKLPIRALRNNIEPFQPLEGKVTAEARIRGTDKAPVAEFKLSVEKPVIAGLPFDSLSAEQGEFLAGPGILRVAKLELVKGWGEGKEPARIIATGALPLPWKMDSGKVDAPRSLMVSMPSFPLAVFHQLAEDAARYAEPRDPEVRERLEPTLVWLRRMGDTVGNLEAQVSLAGTQSQPLDSGSLRVSDATIKLETAQTEIRDFNALVSLKNGLLTVEECDGVSSHGGSVGLEGTVELPRGTGERRTEAHLDLSLLLGEFKFVEKKVVGGAADRFRGAQYSGTIHTVDPKHPAAAAPLRLVGPASRAALTGGIRLDDANLALLVQWGSGGGFQPVPFDMKLDLSVLVGDKVWVKNPQAQLRLANTLTVTQTLQDPLVKGVLEVEDGTFTLPTMRLRQVEGTVKVDFQPAAAALGGVARSPVYVDLVGTTHVSVQRLAGGETEDYELTVEIKGSPTPPPGESRVIQTGFGGTGGGGLSITVRSDPPLPSREIEALIRQQLGAEGFAATGTNVVEALRTQIEAALSVNVTSAITRPIEEALRSTFGLDIVSVELGMSDQPLRVRIGKRIVDRLWATMSQDLGRSDGLERRFELYYRVTPRLRIGFRDEEPLGRKSIFFSGSIAF